MYGSMVYAFLVEFIVCLVFLVCIVIPLEWLIEYWYKRSSSIKESEKQSLDSEPPLRHAYEDWEEELFLTFRRVGKNINSSRMLGPGERSELLRLAEHMYSGGKKT